MKIYTSPEQVLVPPFRAHVTIGNFDGVHLGHQQLFARVVESARQDGGVSVAITFDPHPLKLLSPGGIRLISSTEQKIELIERAGVDELLIIPFDREMAATSAEDFVERILVRKLDLRNLVVGYDYALGRGRIGDTAFLQEQGARRGFSVEVVPAFYVRGRLVSSSVIRELVSAGKMRDVRALLGRHYQIRGSVQRGRQRGSQLLGYPTANLRILAEDLCPKRGVYVTRVTYGGTRYGGVSNIGYNPTFGEENLVAETHIFGFRDDIYGQPLRISLLRHLRDERRFDSPAELIAQIEKDIVVARRVLARES